MCYCSKHPFVALSLLIVVCLLVSQANANAENVILQAQHQHHASVSEPMHDEYVNNNILHYAKINSIDISNNISSTISNTTTTNISALASANASFSSWPLWVLCLFCLITVVLSAIYCGLTIGILGMDSIYMEIIADAGPLPDKRYASDILPLRRLGHRLLVTLLLGNMLTLVLTSQLVAAIVQSSELINFIAGTLIVLIFGEILPMSVCKRQKYALYIGSKSLPVLQISLIVLYPIAKPLAMLLDCVVHHDDGMVYDKQELKKLLRLHCDKYADQTGMDRDQVKMMLRALEVNEVNVRAIMTPIDEVFMLNAEEFITLQLQERLWAYGHSRIPVYDTIRSNIIGILYVKDLINVTVLGNEWMQSVRSFVVEHPRDVLVIHPNTLIRETLLIFENTRSQLLLVAEDVQISTNETSSSTNNVESDDHYNHMECGESSIMTSNQHALPTLLNPITLLHGNVEHYHYCGIVTMEDVIEQLIGSEIYDEDEFGHTTSENICTNDTNNNTNNNNVTIEDENDLLGTVNPREAPPSSSNINKSVPLLTTPVQAPRVNFYSYRVKTINSVDNNECSNNNNNNEEKEEDVMTEDQKWVLAKFLSHQFIFFASWDAREVKLLLDHVGEYVITVNKSNKDKNNHINKHINVNVSEDKSDVDTDDNGDYEETSTNKTSTFAHYSKNRDPHETSSSSSALASASSIAQEKLNADRNIHRTLYTANKITNVFTYILSGGVTVEWKAAKIKTEVRSFTSLGDEVLQKLQPFVPDYTAIVSRNTRLVQISIDDYIQIQNVINEQRMRCKHLIRGVMCQNILPKQRTDIEISVVRNNKSNKSVNEENDNSNVNDNNTKQEISVSRLSTEDTRIIFPD